MHLRRDPLLAAGRIMDAINRIAVEADPRTRATVGVLQSAPGSINTVPEKVFMTLDLRHEEDAVVALVEERIREAIERISQEGKLESWSFDRIFDSPAVKVSAPFH